MFWLGVSATCLFIGLVNGLLSWRRTRRMEKELDSDIHRRGWF